MDIMKVMRSSRQTGAELVRITLRMVVTTPEDQSPLPLSMKR